MNRLFGSISKKLTVFTALFVVLTLLAIPTMAQTKSFKVAWSIYVGWMPWPYAQESGILAKHASQNGIQIELVKMDYVKSLEAYVDGKVDACPMTNMDCLAMPAAAGIDSTALIIGDYSNGNDAILTSGLTIAQLPGNDVHLVELSVSHYLLSRCLEKNGLKESQVKVVNADEKKFGSLFKDNPNAKALVTWNPMVMQIEQTPGVSKVFSSADIPGEILDMMVVNTKVLKANPALGKALVGAWYEVMNIMSKRGHSQATGAFAAMSQKSEATVTEYKAQLKTTAMFYTPKTAVDYAKSKEIQTKMNFVRQFCFSHGLLGKGAKSVDALGIQYPDGSIQGDRNNVKMRINVSFMQEAIK